MEVIGEYLGFQHGTGILHYIHAYHLHYFPHVRHLHCTTFSRHAADSYHLAEQVRCWIRDHLPYDVQLGMVDSLALAICQFTRAPRCQRFRGDAAYGQDHLTRQRLYGFRVQMRVCWPGVICQFEVTPGNGSELDAARDMSAGTHGLLLGDRNFWSPRLRTDLAAHDIALLAPFRQRKTDPWPHQSYLLSRWRYRIDTMFGQLVDRTHLKRVWARDLLHLCHWLLRKVLMHTVAIWTTLRQGASPLHFDALVA